MKEKLIFISDLEMGRGDVTDDFSDDAVFVDFLEKIGSKSDGEHIVLVLNGDIFDFLKMAYKGKYPRYITEKISLWKLEETRKAHTKFFEGLKSWLKNPRHSVHFLIGNHDSDLAWPAVREKIKEYLEENTRIKFDYELKNEDLHAEHGHQQDAFFHIDTEKPFIEYKGKQILNQPWGAYVCSTRLVRLKRKFPHEECLYPNPLALRQNPEFEQESKKTTFRAGIKDLFINPILNFGNPTYRPPYFRLLKHIIAHGLNVVDDEKFIKQRVADVIKKSPDQKLIVLGHAHVLTEMEFAGKKVLMTDTWRDEYDLTNNSKKKPKSYVEISYKDDKLISADLKIL
jgi:UDP-2,3-diacylglucosamine pyrophosphatase LpxH